MKAQWIEAAHALEHLKRPAATAEKVLAVHFQPTDVVAIREHFAEMRSTQSDAGAWGQSGLGRSSVHLWGCPLVLGPVKLRWSIAGNHHAKITDPSRFHWRDHDRPISKPRAIGGACKFFCHLCALRAFALTFEVGSESLALIRRSGTTQPGLPFATAQSSDRPRSLLRPPTRVPMRA